MVLVRNTEQLPNEIIIKKVLVSDGSKVSGTFHHWGGTSTFPQHPEGKVQIQTEQLSDIADKNTCFIKSDTDGYDFKILMDGLEWLAEVHPAILFENQSRKDQDYKSANELLTSLMQIGCTYFIVWDERIFSRDNQE